MYHPEKLFKKRQQKILVIAILLSLFFPLPKAVLAEGIVHRSSVQANAFALIPSRKIYRHKPDRISIYETDGSPLGDRMPFVLVHGLRGEYYRGFRWNILIKHFEENETFAKKFKIYLFRYDSLAPLSETVPLVRKSLTDLYETTGHQPINVLALSIGGSLIYNAMLEPSTNAKVKLLFTLGTPFHGSPLFSRDWLLYGVYKNLSWPGTRIDHAVAYDLYFKRNPNLLIDYRWDNCDGGIPNIGHFASRLPFGPHGNLTVEESINKSILASSDNGFDRKKLITYGGYLLNPYMLPERVGFVENTVMAPYTLLAILLPAHFARERPVLKMLNRQISTIVTIPALAKKAKSPFVYALNDGITPVVSALFLKPEVCREYPVAHESDVYKIKKYIDVRTARIFRNVDHLTVLDGYRPRLATNTLRDELNPETSARSIFNWMLYDIAEANGFDSQLGNESKNAEELN